MVTRTRTAVAVVAAALALGACAPSSASLIDDKGTAPATEEGSAEETVEEAPLPPGFYLSGEFVELGPRDLNAPEPEWISPCDEIPDEVLEKAGLDSSRTKQGDFAGMTTCVAEPHDPNLFPLSVGITTGPTFLEELIHEENRNPDYSSSAVPGAVLYEPRDGTRDFCAIGVDTDRGFFAVNASVHAQQFSFEQKCEVATVAIETIYLELRGE